MDYLKFCSSNIQAFLTSFSTFPQSAIDKTNRKIDIRHSRSVYTPEVEVTLQKVITGDNVSTLNCDLKVSIAVLKEFLRNVDHGLFQELTEEFFKIPRHSPLEMTLIYLHSIIHELPYTAQQFTYLLCVCIMDIAKLAGGPTVENFTNLLMHFTPVMFPGCDAETVRFLRTARLLLVMIEQRPKVFLPLPLMDDEGILRWLDDEMEFNERIMLKKANRNSRDELDYCDSLFLKHPMTKSTDSGIENDGTGCSTTSKSTEGLFDLVSGNVSSQDDENIYSTTFERKCSLSMPDLYRFTYSLDDEESMSV